jgi:Ca2+-binding RTX toxin-like protein
LEGNEGNDRLVGNGGSDQLVGGLGNDIVEGGKGNDFLSGDEGIDELSYADSDARVVVNLGTSSASGGDAGGDSISGFENLRGSAFNDVLTGSDAANRLRGELGDDRLNGGKGNDQLIGGGGDDRYVFDEASFGKDEIAGFRDGSDRIDLRGSGLTFASFNEAQVGASTVLSLIGNANVSITLLSTQAADIGAEDFIV